jgi:hypothetical protein
MVGSCLLPTSLGACCCVGTKLVLHVCCIRTVLLSSCQPFLSALVFAHDPTADVGSQVVLAVAWRVIDPGVHPGQRQLLVGCLCAHLRQAIPMCIMLCWLACTRGTQVDSSPGSTITLQGQTPWQLARVLKAC